jgi:hypothetical protein
MIKPFNRVKLPEANGSIVTMSYLKKALTHVLGKLNITVEGGEVQQTGDGALHLKVAGSAAAHPFKATLAAGVLKVSPGYFYAPDWVGGADQVQLSYIMPTLGGRPLDASPPPSITTALTTGYVVCRTSWTAEGRAKLPWPIAFVSTIPADIDAILLPDPAAQDGTYHVLLARIVDSTVYQQVRSTVHCDVNYAGFDFTESNAAPPVT